MENFNGIAITTGHTCGDACWHAREEVCRCSCGGKNHGIFSRGGEQPQRTAKISGKMYELSEVGPHGEIESRRLSEVRRIDHDWYYDPKGPYLAKPATATQLKNWPELAALATPKPDHFGRLSVNCYILWKQVGSE